MIVLGINGSPKIDGFTADLLDAALEGAASQGAKTERIDISALHIDPCSACGSCNANGECNINDDMKVVSEKLKRADSVIIASPIFFGSLTAQLKAMIDRFQVSWISKYVLKKDIWSDKKRMGSFICVSGQDNREFFENANQIIKVFFLTLSIKYKENLYFGGTNAMTKMGEKWERALAGSRELGINSINANIKR